MLGFLIVMVTAQYFCIRSNNTHVIILLLSQNILLFSLKQIFHLWQNHKILKLMYSDENYLLLVISSLCLF
jgi:hypothetical protein